MRKLILLLVYLFVVGCGAPVIKANDRFLIGAPTYKPYGCILLEQRGMQCSPTKLNIPLKPLTYEQLHDILLSVHSRFSYKSDQEVYNTGEFWLDIREIPKGKFRGDCEDFAQAIRKELHRYGHNSQLAYVVTEDGSGHGIVIYNNYILDNRFKWPMIRTDLDYDFISVSGFTNREPWRLIWK